MQSKDFNHMKRYYNLISVAAVRRIHPNVPWKGTLFGHVFVKENGDIYDGEWKVFKSKSVFAGRYMFHGEGIYYFGLLDQYYIGPLVASQCKGIGQYIWVTTSDVWRNNFDPTPEAPFDGLPFNYKGDIVYEVKHGKATLTFKSGQTLLTIWDHGKIISPSNAYDPSFNSAAVGAAVENPLQMGKRKNAFSSATSSRSGSTSDKRNNSGRATTTSVQEPPLVVAAQVVSSSPSSAIALSNRLKELKDLYDQRLITQEAYHDTQEKMLNEAFRQV